MNHTLITVILLPILYYSGVSFNAWVAFTPLLVVIVYGTLEAIQETLSKRGLR